MCTKLLFILTAAFALTACSPGVYYPLGNSNIPAQSNAQSGHSVQAEPQAAPAKPLGTLEPNKSFIIPS